MGGWEDLRTTEISPGELSTLVAKTAEPKPNLADGSGGISKATVYPVAPRGSRVPLVIVSAVVAIGAGVAIWLLL